MSAKKPPSTGMLYPDCVGAIQKTILTTRKRSDPVVTIASDWDSG